PPPNSPLFPYTTLFRSHLDHTQAAGDAQPVITVGGCSLGPQVIRVSHAGRTTRKLEQQGYVVFHGAKLRPGDVALPSHRPLDLRSEEHTSELQSPDHLV